MIRTKYLFIAVLGCIGSIIFGGIISVLDLDTYPDAPQLRIDEAVPKSSYHIQAELEESKVLKREAFISRVRESLKEDETIVVPPLPIGTSTQQSL